ncbi:MAG: UbiA family prenyltransferase [Patescibacteria group bacterium]
MLAWITVLRPVACGSAALMVILSYYISGQPIDWLLVVTTYTIATTAMVLNNYHDRYIDIEKGILGIHSQRAFRAYASAWSILSLTICIFIGFTRTPGQSLVAWSMLFLSLTYDYIRPIYTLNNLYVAIATSLPLLFPSTYNSYWLASTIFCLIFGREIIKDILDVKHDLPYKLTLPIRIGNREAEEVAITLYASAYCLINGVNPISAGSILLNIAISLVILIIIHLYVKSTHNKLRFLDALTGIHLAWLWLMFFL